MAVALQTAFTEELDEPDVALSEILDQLDLDELKANTLGILYCYPDFIESGVAEYIASELPFDVIGMTTMASASRADEGPYRLTIALITGDDVRFTTGFTPPLSADNYQQTITEAWQKALARTEAPIRFIIGYLPFMQDIAGQEMLEAFDEASDHIPFWGSISAGTDMTYTDCYTVHNEIKEQHGAVFAIIEGAIEPEFVVTSIPERNIYEQKAIITKSHGCILTEINDTPVLDYIRDLGIIFNQGDQTTIPLMVDYRDGSQPVALGMYAFLEGGSILCGGSVPQNALISLGEIDPPGILETAQTTLEQLRTFTDKAGALLLPCVTRFVMLAPNQEDEMKAILEQLEGVFPYQMAYSGGELCPVRTEDGSWRNRFHNFTFSACAL
jgi:hypothetical protein